jgi:hypothetical protein
LIQILIPLIIAYKARSKTLEFGKAGTIIAVVNTIFFVVVYVFYGLTGELAICFKIELSNLLCRGFSIFFLALSLIPIYKTVLTEKQTRKPVCYRCRKKRFSATEILADGAEIIQNTPKMSQMTP